MAFHVKEFCQEYGSLGFFSEQASEAVHHDFKNHWENFKCDKAYHNFSSQIIRAVFTYNSNHNKKEITN